VRKRRLLWQLFPTYLVIIVLLLVGTVWYVSGSLRRFHLKTVRKNLEAEARLIAEQIHTVLNSDNSAQLDELCKKLGREAAIRITLLLPDGRVAADSEDDPAEMENHGSRLEVKAALDGNVGSSTRYSDTLGKSMMYVAVPLEEDGHVVAAVRTSVPLATIGEALYPVYEEIVLVSTIIALATVLLSLAVARRIVRPLREMRRGAERFAAGNLDAQLPVPASDEIGSLAETMNRMARQLHDRIHAITRQNSEQQAILSSMVEGVLAIDTNGSIIRANRAAADMLGVPLVDAEGTSTQEAICNPAVRKFIARASAALEPVEEDIVTVDGKEKYLRLRGAVLHDSDGRAAGVVVVLNDVTRLRTLENMRREFVANVSHELKTPITSVKGFVETLQDGALHVREDAERFLGIISGELDRLNSIIEDLLLLSRVEQDTEKKEILLEKSDMGSILESAVQARVAKADEKRIRVNLEYEEGLAVNASAPLLEHAVVNLVDNAIKYSGEASAVTITAARSNKEVLVSVTDTGCGIDREHIPRVFERFYRVDKARSRKLGGTGLGLAIVKHIVQVHGGYVTVYSVPGEGSTFSIHLPAP
jgi:two-component system phosphate regulon sensor histidine kinase PhoR